MKIRDLGDKVEIIETVDEINKRYSDQGLPEPIYLVNKKLDSKIVAIKTWLTPEEAKFYGIKF